MTKPPSTKGGSSSRGSYNAEAAAKAQDPVLHFVAVMTSVPRSIDAAASAAAVAPVHRTKAALPSGPPASSP
jgi:hypothetical protein